MFGRRTSSGGQFLVGRPVPAAHVEHLLALPVHARRNLIEDVVGVSGVQVPDGVKFADYPVMMRPAAAIEPILRPGVEVLVATSAEELARAEQTIVEGYPRAEALPYRTGTFIPPSVMDNPRCQAWIALRDGAPAAAVVTYDDGESLGFYWLATRAEHRGAGLGAALMTSALAAAPERASALVATRLGRPLYERLGYRVAGRTRWYNVPAS